MSYEHAKHGRARLVVEVLTPRNLPMPSNAADPRIAWGDGEEKNNPQAQDRATDLLADEKRAGHGVHGRFHAVADLARELRHVPQAAKRPNDRARACAR